MFICVHLWLSFRSSVSGAACLPLRPHRLVPLADREPDPLVERAAVAGPVLAHAVVGGALVVVPGDVPGVEPARSAPAPAHVRDVRVERRADRHLVQGYQRGRLAQERGDLQPLFVEFGANADRCAGGSFCQARCRALEVEAGRQAADPAVVRLRPQNEANWPYIASRLPRGRNVRGRPRRASGGWPRHFPEDAVVVQGQLPAVREAAQRRELPADALGHAVVEVGARRKGGSSPWRRAKPPPRAAPPVERRALGETVLTQTT